MSGEEKISTCKHRPEEMTEIFDGCPCKKKKKLVHQCVKRSIVDIKPEICKDCDLYENKNS